MNFKPYNQEAKSLLDVYLCGSGYTGSDFSYHAFLCWFDDVEYAEKDGVLFFRAFFNGELRYWPPLIIQGSDKTLLDAVAMLPKGSALAYADEELKNLLKDDFISCTNRNWSEYVYDVKEFIAMAGNKFSGKRNHITRFKKSYNYTMLPFAREDVDDLINFEGSWLETHRFGERMSESAKKEYRIAKNWIMDVLNGELICDVLRIDGKMAGVSIGEILPSGNCVIIFEKADRNFEGVYTFIAHEFVVRNFSECKYMNRQEDLGIEGLRKSKLSYNPAFLLDKYVLTPKIRCEVDENNAYVNICEGDSSLEENDGEYFEIVRREDMFTDSLEEEHIKINNKIEEIKASALENYVFRQLEPLDFNTVMTFFKCGIRNLSDKKFFMNYTDEELLDVLNSGYMLGGFYENHLIATCGFDADKEFGNRLKDICKDNTDRQFYEFSGIMVCRFHRGKGVAHSACKRVIDYVKQNYSNITLCATVQYNNEASLNNLKKLGFSECAEHAYKEYNFKYLTLEI